MSSAIKENGGISDHLTGTILRWLCVVFVGLAISLGLTTRFDWWIEDKFAGYFNIDPPENLVMVAVDPRSVSALGAEVYDTQKRAKVIKSILDDEALQIFVDFRMAHIDNEQIADELRQTLLSHHEQPVGFPIVKTERFSTQGRKKQIGKPDIKLTNAASFVSVNVPLDNDGLARRMPEQAGIEGKSFPSVPHWLSGKRSHPATDDDMLQNDLRVNFSINLSGIKTISYIDVLNGIVDPGVFKNKRVVIGSSDLILGDQLIVPRYSMIAGSEFLTLATASLMVDRALSEVGQETILISSVALSFLCALFFPLLDHRKITVIAAAAIGFAIFAAYVAQSQFDLLIKPVGPVLSIASSSVVALVLRSGWLARFSQKAAAVIAEQTSLIARLLESSRDGVLTIDEHGQILTSNKVIVGLIGTNPDQQNICEYLSIDHDDYLDKFTRPSGLFEASLLGVNGNIPVEIAFNCTEQSGKKIIVAMLRDLRERKAQETALKHLASTDMLTQLANRYALERAINQFIEMEGENDFALMLIDLDHFKDINDTLGHAVGDEILSIVARRLKRLEERDCFVARLGGDEFAVIAPLVRLAADEIASDIQEHLEEPIKIQDIILEVGFSLGYSIYPANGAELVTLLQKADIAMYAAKRHGGGIYQFQDELDQHSIRKLTLRGQLRQAINLNQFTLYYQPKIDAKRHLINGAEALIRWQHPDHGFVPPDEFIPAAEQSGIIRELTYWCIDRALSDRKSFKSSQKITFAVNLSARLLHDSVLIRDLEEITSFHGVPNDFVKIEITESAVMTQSGQTQKNLESLVERGFVLSLDDFGAGYSSFGYLRQLPVSELKIDRLFLLERDLDPKANEILLGIIALAHRLGLSVVCEGVEDLETYQWLCANGCDTIQGYFTGKPMPLHQFIKWQLPVGLDPGHPLPVEQKA